MPQIISVEKWKSNPTSAVIVADVRDEGMAELFDVHPTQISEFGYCLANKEIKGVNVITAAGNGPRSTAAAVYGLLRQVGFGFNLGSEYAPQSLPEKLAENIQAEPKLDVRGVLPWYNFFNSPTTWDPIDHRALVDQLIRSGANFVGFHTYNNEPFGAYEENGEIKMAARLGNTSVPTWGSKPLKSRDFPFGIDNLFADEYFGAKTTLQIEDDREAIKAEVRVLAEALEYAHQRGLKTCVGFEAHGNPYNPSERDAFIARFNTLLDTYRNIDYVWIWQPEAWGWGHSIPKAKLQDGLTLSFDPDELMTEYGKGREDVFRRAVKRTAAPEFPENPESDDIKFARAKEGARMEQFAMLAWRQLQHRAVAPRLVISCWGGVYHCMGAEYYEGLDKVLPGDVIFSGLDCISVRPQLDKIYHELPRTRQRWPIIWLENDGDQWHPQPFVNERYGSLVKDIMDSGSQGALGIHWRTRDLEENFGYMIEQSWKGEISAKDYYNWFGKQNYEPKIAERAGLLHCQLDELGYRWGGGGRGGEGYNECGSFGKFSPGNGANTEKLKTILRQIENLRKNTRDRQSGEKLDWLINRCRWALDFDQFQKDGLKATELIKQAKETADETEKKRLAEEAIALLDCRYLAQAVHNYAGRMTTRGEYGVLATIMTKAYPFWIETRKEAFEIAGNEYTNSDTVWNPQSKIILPRFFSSVEEHEPIAVEPIILGGSNGYLHYRNLGEKEYKTIKLARKKGWVYQAAIPAEDVTAGGVEIKLSLNEDSSEKAQIVRTFTVMSKTPTAGKTSAKTGLEGETGDLEITAGQDMLSWDTIKEADYFKIYKDDNLAGQSAASFYPAKEECSWRVEAIRDGNVICNINIKK